MNSTEGVIQKTKKIKFGQKEIDTERSRRVDFIKSLRAGLPLAFIIPQILKAVAQLISTDKTNTSTEFERIFKITAEGKVQWINIVPFVSLRGNDGNYMPDSSEYWIAHKNGSVTTFHFHALTTDNSESCGPGSCPAPALGGDL